MPGDPAGTGADCMGDVPGTGGGAEPIGEGGPPTGLAGMEGEPAGLAGIGPPVGLAGMGAPTLDRPGGPCCMENPAAMLKQQAAANT